MKRIISAVTIAAMAMFFAASPAQSASKSMTMTCPAGERYVKGYTKADGTKVDGYCQSKKRHSKSTDAASMAPMSSMAPMPMTSPASSMNGSSTSGASGAAVDSCPAGERLVHGYTKKDGTKVAAYCRHSRTKKS